MTRLGKESKEQWPIGYEQPQEYLNVVVTREPSPQKSGIRWARLIVLMLPVLMLMCGVWAFAKSSTVSGEFRTQAFNKDFSEVAVGMTLFGDYVKEIPQTNSLWPLSLLFAVPFLAFLWWVGGGIKHFVGMFWSSTES